ncbi:hypothetical protein [Winogradskyella sp.]|uniref:hypothetical protein n=1 Tax=Winogradskyella sp. TaxID=1883156 RepID=UPI003F6A24C9
MAQYEEFTIDQGADVAIELNLVDKNDAVKDISNHTITAKLKKNYNSTDSDTTNFTAIISNPTSGIATLSLTNTQTDALKTGRYVYDVELSFVDSAGATIVERILEGRMQISPSVTK